MAELRRNPLTQKWVVFNTESLDLTSLALRREHFGDNACLFPMETKDCQYCPESASDSRVRIMTMEQDKLNYEPMSGSAGDWQVFVTAAEDPVFRIEDNLKRKSKRLYDVMGSRGAHEVIAMTPLHGAALWDLSVEQLERNIRVLRERIHDLNQDPRLGHSFAYIVYGQEVGAPINHSLMDLVVMPFIPERVHRELKGAQEWFRFKERCLFCDIYEEERLNRAVGKRDNLIDETANFVSYMPFFGSHPFEIWIQPADHYACLLQMPAEILSDLGGIFLRTMKRLRALLGPISYSVYFMNCPNQNWGSERGFWKTLDQDWHWRIRIIPENCGNRSGRDRFFRGTGSRVNPVLPEDAADLLRSV